MFSSTSHQELTQELRTRILSGELPEQSLLGTEIGLAKSTGISRNSVRLAVSALIDEGLVERRPGKGIYVTSTSTKQVIELVLPGLHHIWKDITDGVQEVGRNRDCKVQIFNARSDLRTDMEMLRRLPDMNVDGAIIGSFHQREMTEEVIKLHLSGLPIVLLDQQPADVAVSSVVFDSYRAGYIAGEELLKAGHRRIGFIGYGALPTRVDGLRDAVNDGGVAFDRTNIVDTPLSWIALGEQRQDLTEALTRLLHKDNAPTAIVFHNTGMALLGMRCLKTLGYQTPEDISVVAIGDEPDLQWIDSTLSAVELPALEMGRIAMELLLERIQNPDAPVRQITLPVKWQPRQSIRTII